MNLMFTTYCNQKCPYCFGQDAMDARGSRRSDKEISEKNLQFVLDFIKRSGHKGINIIGGEPTLHPEFKKRYRQIEKAGLSVMIFSNCVMGEDTAVFLSKKKSLTDILLNIREPWEYSTGDWNKIRTTLKQLNLSYSETEVLAVTISNKSGALADVTGKLARSHVNISYAYCTAGAAGGKTTGILKVADVDKAIKVLKKKPAVKKRKTNIRRSPTSK